MSGPSHPAASPPDQASRPASGKTPNGPAEAADGFRLGLDLVAGRLTARGRLHRGTAHLVHDAIVAMLATEREHWWVDITELVVNDRFGLRVLTTAYRRLLHQGRRMTLEGASPELQRALIRLRLDHHLLPQRCDEAANHAERRDED